MNINEKLLDIPQATVPAAPVAAPAAPVAVPAAPVAAASPTQVKWSQEAKKGLKSHHELTPKEYISRYN